MKSKLFLIAFMLVSSFCYAQSIEISGKVNEVATGLPMPGVNVTVKNSTVGTVTDMDGNFTISAPLGSTLAFSFIGFKPQEVAVTGKTMTVSLAEDAKTLDEVVVIGYGSQKRKEVTGAVGIVDSKTLEQLKPIKVEQALQGTVSGVNVSTQSGAPGGNLTIRIRGVGTNGNPDPTVIVDGYVLNNTADLGLMNPNDIESITVLKDAQAAIYGTIGANGVVLVTTKKGRKNTQTSFSYNTYTGFQETSKKMNLLNSTEYALLLNESYVNGGKPLPFPDVSKLGQGTNWQDRVFEKGAAVINHDFSVSGGGEKITYNLSGSHVDQDGIVGGDKSNFKRDNARIGLTADLTDKLKLSTNIMYTSFNRRSFNENVVGSVLFNAINTPSIYRPYDKNGEFTVLPIGNSDPGSNLGIEIINPLAQIANTFNDYNFKKIGGTVAVDYELIKDLVVTNRIGFNSQNARERIFNKMVDYGGTKVFNNARSSVNQNSFQDNDYSYDLYGTYKKSFAEAHNFTFTVGMTAFKSWGEGLYATGFDVPNNDVRYADINLTTGIPLSKNVGSYSYDERRLSQFARVQYDYKGRYLLSGMIRRDSSTKFGPNNRVAYFPSVTGGWIISDEPFYGQSKTLSFAKLRASYGILGSDKINNNQYLGLLNGEGAYVFDGAITTGRAIGALSNPDIKWEEAKKFDVGVDLRLFNDKVDLTADYFREERKNLLIGQIPISGIIGTYGPGGLNPTLNAGTVLNKGLELAVNYSDKIGDDFNFRVGYNVTFIKNEVLLVNNGTGYFEGGSFGVGQPAITRMEAGQPLGYFYGYQADGVFQNQAEVDAHPSQAALGAPAQPGDIRFKDVNGDGQITNADRTNVGDPIPDATMGFNLQLNYKGFDLAAYAFASLGNDMVRNYERVVQDANKSNYLLDRWHGEGTSNTVPRVTTGATTNNIFSSYFVEDASYLRIQNVQLGYTINENFTKRAGITKLRLYAGVNNLYTFTKYRGFDPGASSNEPLASGIDFGFYPVPRTYLLGLNLNF
ncbi:Vitamin B12 transporter BtuB [compost metagenome]